MSRVVVFSLSFTIAVSRVLSAQVTDAAAKLPGLGIDIPVDVNGDGQDSYGDRYFFNWWLDQGGDLDLALSTAKAEGKVIDLSVFFASSDAQLAPSGKQLLGTDGGVAAGAPAGTCVQPGSAPNHTRRIPPDRTPSCDPPDQFLAASFHPRMTPDSRFVVFSSAACNLPGATADHKPQIYRFEQGAAPTAAVILQMSLTTTGTSSPKDCNEPSISNDGKRVVFKTAAALAPDDIDSVSDIYLRDLTNAANPKTVRLTAPRVGVLRGNGSFGAVISGNGQFVAFTSSSGDLSSSDTDGITLDVFRVAINTDSTAGAIVMASVKGVGVQTVFPMSTAGDGILGHICPGSTTLCPSGPIAASGCECPSVPCPDPDLILDVGRVISDDGCFILMHGAPTDWSTIQDVSLCPDPNVNLDSNGICDSNTAIQQVYLRDVLSSFTYLVSKANRSSPLVGCFAANGCCRRASISGDGSRIAFSSSATNLQSSGCDSNCFEDVFFIDTVSLDDGCMGPAPTLVSVGLCASGSADHSNQPSLSADGSFIAFASKSSKLLAPLPGGACPDTGTVRDIFIRKISAPTSTRRFSVDSAGVQAGAASSNPDISGDGNVVVYESLATNLLGAGGDTNNVQDVFQSLSPQGPFIRGDVDLNGKIDLTDAIRIFNWLSSGGPPPACYDAADVDDNGSIQQADGTRITGFLFQGGDPPACPFCCGASPPFVSCCGKDPTGDGLPCGVTLSGCTAFSSVDGSCPPH